VPLDEEEVSPGSIGCGGLAFFLTCFDDGIATTNCACGSEDDMSLDEVGGDRLLFWDQYAFWPAFVESRFVCLIVQITFE
jgi:hypothetical protein